jgi:serine protease inhibitor ecotin
MKIESVKVCGGCRDVTGSMRMRLGGKLMTRARSGWKARSRDGTCVSISHVPFVTLNACRVARTVITFIQFFVFDRVLNVWVSVKKVQLSITSIMR